MLVQGVLMTLVVGFLQIPAFAAVYQYFDKKRAAALGFPWTVRTIGFIVLPFMIFACKAIKPCLPQRKVQLFFLSPYKKPRFIMLFTALFFMFIGMFTPFFYIPSYATIIIPGILADKYWHLNMFATGGFITGVVVFCMTAATTNAGLIVFSVVFGFTSGMVTSGASAAFSNCSKDVGDNWDLYADGNGSGRSGSPNRAILDAYGGYSRVCMFSGSIALVGGIIAFAAKSSYLRRSVWPCLRVLYGVDGLWRNLLNMDEMRACT
ncbi:hypothetical protein BJX99DRAFT_256434 [Aspergillus californicus]